MTVMITSKQDMSRVTRWLSAHPDVEYAARAGEGGIIALDVRVAPGTVI